MKKFFHGVVVVALCGMSNLAEETAEPDKKAAQRERTWIRYNTQVQTHQIDFGDVLPEEEKEEIYDPSARRDTLFRSRGGQPDLGPQITYPAIAPTPRTSAEEDRDENWLTPDAWKEDDGISDGNEGPEDASRDIESIFEQYEEQLNQYSLSSFLERNESEEEDPSTEEGLSSISDELDEQNDLQQNLLGFEPVIGLSSPESGFQEEYSEREENLLDQRAFAESAEVLLEDANALTQDFAEDENDVNWGAEQGLSYFESLIQDPDSEEEQDYLEALNVADFINGDQTASFSSLGESLLEEDPAELSPQGGATSSPQEPEFGSFQERAGGFNQAGEGQWFTEPSRSGDVLGPVGPSLPDNPDERAGAIWGPQGAVGVSGGEGNAWSGSERGAGAGEVETRFDKIRIRSQL